MKKLLFLTTLILATASTLSSKAHAEGDLYNVRINPIGLLVAAPSVTFDIAVGEDWTIGPTFSYTDVSIGTTNNDRSNGVSYKGGSFGARGNYFFNGAFNSGWYLAPSLEYRNVTYSFQSSNGSNTYGSSKGALLTALGGYGWFWSGFNIMLGAGVEHQFGSSSTVSVVDNDGNNRTREVGTQLTGEFTLGWKF